MPRVNGRPKLSELQWNYWRVDWVYKKEKLSIVVKAKDYKHRKPRTFTALAYAASYSASRSFRWSFRVNGSELRYGYASSQRKAKLGAWRDADGWMYLTDALEKRGDEDDLDC